MEGAKTPSSRFLEVKMTERFVSKCCEGERCWCNEPAQHKVEETIFSDDPHPHRHPFTAYVCHYHFCEIMGAAIEAAILPSPLSISCPKCGLTSYNLNDVRARYCAVCGFHEDLISDQS